MVDRPTCPDLAAMEVVEVEAVGEVVGVEEVVSKSTS